MPLYLKSNLLQWYTIYAIFSQILMLYNKSIKNFDITLFVFHNIKKREVEAKIKKNEKTKFIIYILK